jgi:hypothetical protein
MNEAFNKWWNSDELVADNPFGMDTAMFWAWEGWVAGVKAEREWQDLTGEEEDAIWDECLGVFDCLKMTQAKLKEKNG